MKILTECLGARRVDTAEVEPENRVLLERVIRGIYIESPEEFPLPFEESLQCRAHQALTESAGPQESVIVVELVAYKLIYVLRLVDIEAVVCSYLLE